MSPDAEDASDSSDSGGDEDLSAMADTNAERASSGDKSGGENKDAKPASKAKGKDADRPKRKKARRACFACQRAHLTCGDERPCLRCVKRGLQDQCHDGIRKKAKYLHDAPAEALLPNFPGNYHVNGSHSIPSASTARQMSSNSLPVSQPGNFYPHATSSTYPSYNSVSQRGQMPPPLMETVNTFGEYPAQQNVENPAQFYANSPQQVSPVQSMSTNMDPSSTLGNAGNGSFDASMIDPNDSSLFNINISDLNFDNRYGALEFGMLGHLSSGAANTPDLEAINHLGASNTGSVSYESGFAHPYAYRQSFLPWQAIPRQTSSTQLWTLNNDSMDAFAVSENTGSVAGASDLSHSQDFNAGYSSSAVSPDLAFAQPDESQLPDGLPSNNSHMQVLKRKQAPHSNDAYPSAMNKKRRNTSEIYDNVTSPHPYTQAFHNLINFLNNRFPSSKVLRIAKALASFRPSFISCNKNLTTDDLVFMEKCFQRTLYEYEDFLDHTGTPTIICRRTGEIATVSKEFSLVTGWPRDVLLGKAPNLNVNTGSRTSGTGTGASTKGTATPRAPAVDIDPGRPQGVFLAEVMDQDSVVQFYEDFAELAFGASRSSIIGARCTLHKYKTKYDAGWAANGRMTDDERGKGQGEVKTESLMKGEAGTNTLGDSDGRLEAVLCWTVKRDVFDIPMMIVFNFLPII